MSLKVKLVALFLILLGGGYAIWRFSIFRPASSKSSLSTTESTIGESADDLQEDQGGLLIDQNPLSIPYMRQQQYPGSDLVIEQTLNPGTNYQRYIVSYKSEGLKQFAMLTVPDGTPPSSGWPAIVFNHGYIPPDQYRTTERYVAYVDGFAGQGYVVLKPDYRGHGNSEGQAVGGYGSPAYTIDVLNAFSSLQKYPGVDPQRIGMWGHSMGGSITLRAMVITPDIKAGVIWSGVVGSYPDLINNWHHHPTPTQIPTSSLTNNNQDWSGRRRWRDTLIDQYGPPTEDSEFWQSISPTAYLQDISGPLQLHHATGDTSVPVEFSRSLQTRMQAVGKPSELYIYQGDNHNLSQNFSLAMQRSVAFFDKYLKSVE